MPDYGIGVVVVEKNGKKKMGYVKFNFDLEKKYGIIDESSLVVKELAPLTISARTALVDEILRRDKER